MNLIHRGYEYGKGRLRDMAGAGKQQTNNLIQKLRENREKPETEIKPMLMECCDHDLDSVEDFLEALSDEERSIIDNTDDPKVVMKIKMRVDQDIDDSAKSLEIDG